MVSPEQPSSDRPPSSWRAPANLLSLARLPLGASFWLVIDASPRHLWGPFAVLAAAAITDVLDGVVARRLGTAARGVGSWLDPLCDKLFVGAVLGAILFHRTVPLAALLLIVSRELIQLPLALIYRLLPVLHRWLRYDFQASAIGKAATIFQFLAVAALLLDVAVWPLAWAAFATGIISLFDYLRRAIAIGERRLVGDEPAQATAPTTRSR
jgi:phosphatidylglycerophosphate synthase